MKILILLILMMSACYHDPSIAKCDEEIGVKAANEQNSGLAYQSLKNCENDPNASGEALHYLHSLVSFDGQGQYQSFQSRMDHSFNLECKAARKGYIVAIRWFGSVYQQGDSSLNITPNEEVSKCFINIKKTSLKYADPIDFSTCFSLISNGGADSECRSDS